MNNAITNIPKYDKYKDSGFDWIGNVPVNWDVTDLGKLLKPISIKNHPELPLLSITREKGVIKRDVEDQDSNHNFIPDDLSGYKLIERGQFGMNKMKAWQGSYGVSDYTGIVSPAYFIFNFRKAIVPDYFHFAIRSKLYVSYFGSASDGVRIGQWDLSKPRMKMIPFLIPSVDEQKAIADFLDKKTKQIDDAVAIKERQIELLKEHKQIIIQNAVTKGLNPNTPMKDSGVEWIGDIPEHWDIKKLKFLGKMFAGLTDKKGDDFSKEEKEGFSRFIPFTSIGSSLMVKPKYEYVKVSKIEAQNTVLKGDILFLMSSETFEDIANCSIYQDETQSPYLNSFCKGLRLQNNSIDNKYATYFLQSNSARVYFILSGRGFTRINIKQEYIKNSLILLPPIDEQKIIADFLDIETQKIEKSIEQQQQLIEKLKEYKSSLINSAVTGKIKII